MGKNTTALQRDLYKQFQILEPVMFARIQDIFYDENRPVIRLDIETFRGLSVADQVRINREIDINQVHAKINYPAWDRYYITAFVELNGYLKKNKKIVFKNIACILSYRPDIGDEYVLLRSFGPSSGPGFLTNNVLLFWTDNLELIQDQN